MRRETVPDSRSSNASQNNDITKLSNMRANLRTSDYESDTRRLRSALSLLFCAVPRTKTRLVDRSLAAAVPRIWNSSPVASLRSVDDYTIISSEANLLD